MKRLILALALLATIAAIQVAVDQLIRGRFTVGPMVAAATAQQVSRFDAGAELESATDASGIVRWTCPNPGGTALHYGIVHYGASAMSLTEIAQSPNRRNPANPEMTFRVRIMGLKPHTTYYYTVESVDAGGVSDGRPGPVKTFQTM